MKLTVHIGSHKSGSTAIQKYCALAQDQLAANGICYPLGLFPNYANQHSELAPLTRAGRGPELDEALALAVARAGEAGFGHVFLSGEDLCSCGPADVARLHAATGKLFDEVQIALVLRNKFDYLRSHYNHALRHAAGTIGAEDFRRSMRFNPKDVLARWQPAYGAENVTVVPYQADDGRSLLSRFFETVLGVATDDDIVAQCGNVNASFDMTSALIVNELLKPLDSFDLAKINVAWIRAFRGQKPRLPILEHDVGRLLSQLYDDADWDIEGLDLLKEPDAPEALTPEEAIAYLDALAKFIATVRAEVVAGHPGAPASPATEPAAPARPAAAQARTEPALAGPASGGTPRRPAGSNLRSFVLKALSPLNRK